MNKGRVIQSTGSWYKVQPKKADMLIECRLPGRFRENDNQLTNPISVGDYVSFSFNDDGSGTIEEIDDRQNYIIRQATHGRRGQQILASNVDQAFVVQSISKPPFKQGFTDRFLVMCEAYQLKPIIIINKMDLASEGDKRFIADVREMYRTLGYQMLTTSIHDEQSLTELKEKLKDHTSAFIGPSGVGKTSLLNNIDPNISRKVADISDYSSKGKHTTTYAKLIELHFGGYLVDTPGIREFGLVDIEPWELSLFFPEMIEAREDCKFNNCTHSHEPSCGIQQAFEAGKIDADRYHSYLQMLESLKENQ